MNNEKIINPLSGYLMLILNIVLLLFSFVMLAFFKNPIIGIPLLVLGIFILPGFIAIEPNSSRVLTLFGKYMGTIKASGFFWINPFYLKKKDFITCLQLGNISVEG